VKQLNVVQNIVRKDNSKI